MKKYQTPAIYSLEFVGNLLKNQRLLEFILKFFAWHTVNRLPSTE